ncbi:PDR/VanB family oxidoreductase [Bordetella pseudohinzii]|uniref:Phthalate 4,5-dioxygenase n=1 Tax=Bordetella pseudohinzii TaxID=1331258 RepID=A0A0J6BYM4_9BORD|nr:PDR/VanB family oxidoreductase [Bordetella pseudohinzii]ANY14583.1 phthalate 4,5-dioxygenase [Bordetella pseudohinzii]KMM26774.1 phthalate 4,5-dioxygenase [Bordetella pseudohinzii]KXA79899.1 phthalate 4,5-dioxygenase [Bordetella pseudohinzii]KXA81130.1 phthalate 4,5-dioxygenase [Bordetella pseudohinzii]CUI62340.1 Phthalate dioxygenase reductase [Bordetella pseudohinzii]
MNQSAHEAGEMMPLRIVKIADAAEGIRSFELARDDGAPLPGFTAGSHIRVRVPNGELRKYSLCNDPAERGRYVIAVKRDAQGRGGSISLVDQAREGDVLPTSAPDNAFALVDNPGSLTFIAGGIGITPILSMIRSFGELPPAPWKLYYLSQAAQTTAFLDELSAPELKGHVKIHHDQGQADKAFDLWPVLEKPNRGHVYCCGPRGLMEAVRDMSGHWSPGRIHFESFLEGGGKRPDDRPFSVELASSGQTLEVPVGRSILSVLREAGVRVAFSCESGTCGSCRTGMLAGSADHRDMVLLPEEQASQIMVCVSRASCDKLVLDL